MIRSRHYRIIIEKFSSLGMKGIIIWNRTKFFQKWIVVAFVKICLHNWSIRKFRREASSKFRKIEKWKLGYLISPGSCDINVIVIT
jgi:hypothetical protein